MGRNLRVIGSILIASIAWPQTSVTIHVNDPRPLKKAIDDLELAIKVPINYEDPRFEAPTDIEDVTDQVQNERQKAAHPNVRISVPKGGILTFEGNVASPGALSEAISLATILRTQHESKGYPGRFSVKRIGSIATVQPTSIRAAGGLWKATTAAMDTPISFPSQARSAADTLALIATTLSKNLGIETGVGRFAMVAFANSTATIGADQEPASAILVKLLEEVSRQNSQPIDFQSKYSYRLLFDPGLRRYFLHIRTILPENKESERQLEQQRPNLPSKGRFLISGPDDK
jgi:hypothetical protein